MNKRLNTWMRDHIVDAAVEKAGVNKDRAAYKADRARWAEAIADESIGGPDKRRMIDEINGKIAKLASKLCGQVPEKLIDSNISCVERTGSIYANIAGCKVYVSEWPCKIPAINHFALAADHPLSVQFFELEKRREDLDSRNQSIKDQVRALVNSVTTVSALLKAWPEAAELLPKDAAPAPQLPAVQTADLNKLIGLPSDATATEQGA